MTNALPVLGVSIALVSGLPSAHFSRNRGGWLPTGPRMSSDQRSVLRWMSITLARILSAGSTVLFVRDHRSLMFHVLSFPSMSPYGDPAFGPHAIVPFVRRTSVRDAPVAFVIVM